MHTPTSWELEMGLIEFVCDAHDPARGGPTVTPIRGSWRYCGGPDRGGHRWRRIEPVSRERLERYVLPEVHLHARVTAA